MSTYFHIQKIVKLKNPLKKVTNTILFCNPLFIIQQNTPICEVKNVLLFACLQVLNGMPDLNTEKENAEKNNNAS